MANSKIPEIPDGMSILVAFSSGQFDEQLAEAIRAESSRDRAAKDRANAARKVKREWARARRAAYESVGMKRTPYGYE